jgi:hypothetical protein
MCIALPQQILEQTVKCFQQVVGHPREKWLGETLQQCYHHPKFRYTIYKSSVSIANDTNCLAKVTAYYLKGKCE